jgi:hypothetical protein
MIVSINNYTPKRENGTAHTFPTQSQIAAIIAAITERLVPARLALDEVSFAALLSS